MKKFDQPESKYESEYYTAKGFEAFVDSDGYPRTPEETKDTLAKAIRNRPSRNFDESTSLHYSFYVRTDPNRNLYNPTKLYSIQSSIKKNFINNTCKSNHVFTEVSKSVFDSYINFLKTENPRWLTQAQRDLR